LHELSFLLIILLLTADRKKARFPEEAGLSLSKKVTFWWPFSRIERENAV